MLEAQLLYPARVRSRPHSIYIAETYHQKIGEYNMGRGKEKVPQRVPERGLGRCLLGLPSYSFPLGPLGQGCSLDHSPISLAFPGTLGSHGVWICDESQQGSHRRGTGDLHTSWDTSTQF